MSKYLRRGALVMGTVGLSAFAALAGPLTPPPGAVAPTMKTLDAIEPRLLLRDVAGNAQCVHRITAPGQYVATTDIVVPSGKHGILLDPPPGTTGSISIDLNGFEVRGQPGSLDGVRKAGAFVACNFNVQNGTIVAMGGDGVHIENTEEASLCVSVRQCGGDGMEFMGVPQVSGMAINQKAPPPGAGNIVKGMGGHCVRASGCGEVVINLTMSDAAMDGLRIENCDRCVLSFDVSHCAGNGVTITGCPEVQAMAINKPASYWGIGVRNRVAHCNSSGVVITQCGDVQMSGVTVLGSGGGGGGGVVGAGRGIVFNDCDRVALQDCAVADSTNHGVEVADCAVLQGDAVAVVEHDAAAGADLQDCAVADSTNHGVEVADCDVASLSAIRLNDIGGNGLHATASTDGKWIEISDWSWDIEADTIAGDGVHISGISTINLQGGTISNCGGDGVHIEDGVVASDKFAQVRGFKVERCAGDGMEIECDDLLLDGCETRSNGGHGVYAKEIRKNLTINLHHSQHNQGTGLLSDDSGMAIRAQGKSTQVTRSNISNNRGAGIQLEVTGSLTMAEVEASGNDLAGCSLLCPSLLSVQEKVKQKSCRFTNNGFGTPTAAPGLLINGASSAVLEDIECSGNAGSGLVVADLDRDGRLDLVTCSNNGEYGVRFTTFTGMPGGRVRARELFCDGNAFDGLLFESTSGGEVADSTFSNNGALGVRVLSFNHLVQRCTFSANTGGPLFALLPGNSVAPLVDEGTLGTNCNPSANHVR